MAKPSNTAKAKKSQKSRSPKEGHAKSSGLGARPDKSAVHSKKGGGIKQSAANNKAVRNIKKFANGNKSKNGCLPKLFMLFLPLIVGGAYYFLST